MADERVPTWVRGCGIAAIVSALPTIVWRVTVGAGAHLGTPASWRHSEQLPGSGTTYVLTLSALQLVAALLTCVLFVPRVGRLFPPPLVLCASIAGAVALTAICVLSAINWHRVDPFHAAPSITGWTWLCWACYLAACAWPVLLAATTVGYARGSVGGRG